MGDRERGFLGTSCDEEPQDIRAGNVAWFSLVEDVHRAVVAAITSGVENAKSNSMSREAIATRIAMRGAGTLRGGLLLAERGMTAESRILARSLIEDAFAMAALHDQPDEFIQMLKDDSNASRRNQAKFIEAQELLTDSTAMERLRRTIEAMDAEKTRIMSPKKVAAMGPLVTQYLLYQRLSDDAAHTSAKSLDRHVNADESRTGWNYRWQPATQEENAATLHTLVLAALPIGIGLTQILQDRDTGITFGALAQRFEEMPPVSMI